ncbi:MAG: PAS domain S-box protein [Deltaproteobacteria bacterium]|nr:PAS domain S-box protein [Deltaproteobacteria bacterium]
MSANGFIRDEPLDELHKKVFELDGTIKDCEGLIAALERTRAVSESFVRTEGSRLTLEAIFRYVPEFIIIGEAPDVRISMVSNYGLEIINGKTEELLGHTLEDIYGLWMVYDLDGAKTGLEDLPIYRTIKKGEVILNQEFIIKKFDGTELAVLCNAGPILDKDRRIKGGVSIWRDFTSRKKYEEELKRINTELQRSLTEKRVLEGLMHICSDCKRVMDDKGNWVSMEEYVKERSDALFSFTLCTECIKKTVEEEG